MTGTDQLVEMTESPYESEARLQELLARYPNILAGDQIDPTTPRRWVLVSREVSLASQSDGPGRWAVDHLFLDQDGVPTIVEVKRSSDTRIRREVIGQMIDYASNAVVYWPVEHLRTRFEEQCRVENRDPSLVIDDLIGPDSDTDRFWHQVKTNLQAGRVRLVFVADQIPPELQRSVEFLNGQMDPAEVLAIEIRQFVGLGLTTLVPRVIGQTSAAASRKTVGTTASTTRVPGADEFDAQIAAAAPERLRKLRRLSQWAHNLEKEGLARLYSRTGTIYVSLVAWLPNQSSGIVTIYHDRRSGESSIGVQKSVLERCVVDVPPRLQAAITDRSEIRDISDELLEDLSTVYRVANRRPNDQGRG
ncbi:MAG: hypothetical protein EPO26_09585 [Chloroflexota bacterium]|nr:MAG: hypothetical protein EPO26_09585 [Chloroflexota bacterium]